MRRSLTLVSIALALALLGTACGSSSGSSAAKTKAPEVSPAGDIPDTQAYVAFTAPAGDYTIKVPEGWARSINGTTASFTDHFNTITVETAASSTAPTVATVRAVELPSLQRDVPGFQVGRIETVSRPAGSAVVVTYRADSAPNSVTGKRVALDTQRYELWRNAKLVTITVSGARGSDNVDPWKTVMDSFAWAA